MDAPTCILTGHVNFDLLLSDIGWHPIMATRSLLRKYPVTLTGRKYHFLITHIFVNKHPQLSVWGGIPVCVYPAQRLWRFEIDGPEAYPELNE